MGEAGRDLEIDEVKLMSQEMVSVQARREVVCFAFGRSLSQ